MKSIVKNKRSYYEYTILEKYVAGIKLMGSEVKSIRKGKVSISESYCFISNDEMYIKLISIPKPERILSNKYILYLINKNNNIGYILHYSINTNKNLISLHLISCKGLNDTKTIDYYVMPNLYSKWRRVLSLQNLS